MFNRGNTEIPDGIKSIDELTDLFEKAAQVRPKEHAPRIPVDTLLRRINAMNFRQ